MKKKLPKSVRKYIRKEKARIRKGILSVKEEKELINRLYQRFLTKPKSKDEEKSKLQLKT